MQLPSTSKMNTTKPKTLKHLFIAAAVFSAGITGASALPTLTYDLRATSTTSGTGVSFTNGKTIGVDVAASGTITLDVWAQVTNTVTRTGNLNAYGVITILGTIQTTATGVGAVGSLGGIAAQGPFGFVVVPGATGGSLGTPDGITDLGTTNTTGTGDPAVAKDPNAGGTQVGTQFYASNLANATASVSLVTNAGGDGYEFLMGKVVLTITSYVSGSNTVNWVIPTFTLAANKNKQANFTAGDGIQYLGGTNGTTSLLSVGSAINIIAVPEPSAFGMVALGALGLVGFRRLGLRRVA